MSQVRDPVCGMTIDSVTATGQSAYAGTTYFFCSTACKESFDSDPARYAGSEVLADSAPDSDLERHEPPFTKVGGIVAPKFGSAGSGGAEYERLPERHD